VSKGKMVREDGTMRICLIKPGWGSSGYYSREVLERDGPKLFKAGLHMYANHPTRTEETDRPERDVRDLWSVLETDAAYDTKGPKGEGLYADVKVLPSFQPYAEALAPHIGCSIRALGRAKTGEVAGRKGPVIEALSVARSCDWVTLPGAGGGAVELFEAAREGTPLAEVLPSGRSDQEVDETEVKNLREAMAGVERERDDLFTENGRLKEALLMHEVTGIVAEELSKFDLSDVTRDRLVESLPRRAPITEGKLDAEAYRQQIREAVRAECEYLAKATGIGLGKIRGLGGSSVQESQVREGLSARQEKAFADLLGSDDLAKIAAAGRS
jgi:hypothetical protein